MRCLPPFAHRRNYSALESAHAIAHVTKIAPLMKSDEILVVNLSGRGDKDMQSALTYFRSHT